eukprot:3335-Heterococcus_DN1.PRE.3
MEGNELSRLAHIWSYGSADLATRKPIFSQSPLHHQGKYTACKARAGAKGKLRADTRRLKKLTKHVQASHFLLHFAKWQQKLQKRLRIANPADSTLAALRVWAGYLFYDTPRHMVVLYVIKQLKRFMLSSKQQQCDDMHALKEWSISLHKAAQSAADKLKEVYRSSTLQNTYITALRTQQLLTLAYSIICVPAMLAACCTLCYLSPAVEQPEDLYWSGKSQPPNPPTTLALAQYEQSSSSDTSSISSSSSDAHSNSASSDSSVEECDAPLTDVANDVADDDPQPELESNAAHSPKAKPLISTDDDDDILHEQLQELSPFARAWVPPVAVAAAAPVASTKAPTAAPTAVPVTAAAVAAVQAEHEAEAVQALLAAALRSSSDVSQLYTDVTYTPYPAPGPSDCPAVLKLYMHASSFAQQVAVWQQQQQQQQRKPDTVRSTQDKLKQSAELSRQLGDASAVAAVVYLQLQLQRCALWQVLHSVPQVLDDWQALDLWRAAVAANGRSAATLLNQTKQPVRSAKQHLMQSRSSGTATATAPTAVSTVRSPLAPAATPAAAPVTTVAPTAAVTATPAAARTDVAIDMSDVVTSVIAVAEAEPLTNQQLMQRINGPEFMRRFNELQLQADATVGVRKLSRTMSSRRLKHGCMYHKQCDDRGSSKFLLFIYNQLDRATKGFKDCKSDDRVLAQWANNLQKHADETAKRLQQSERIPQHQREHDAYVAKALSFPLLPYDCVLNTASDDSKKHSETTAIAKTEHFNSMQTVADAGYYLSNYYRHAGVADVYNNALKMLNMDSKHFSHCGEQRLHRAVEHVKSSLLAADEQLSMYEKKMCSAESVEVLNSWFVDQQTAAMQAYNTLLQQRFSMSAHRSLSFWTLLLMLLLYMALHDRSSYNQTNESRSRIAASTEGSSTLVYTPLAVLQQQQLSVSSYMSGSASVLQSATLTAPRSVLMEQSAVALPATAEEQAVAAWCTSSSKRLVTHAPTDVLSDVAVPTALQKQWSSLTDSDRWYQ